MVIHGRCIISALLIMASVWGISVTTLHAQNATLIHFPVQNGFAGESIKIEARFEQMDIPVIYVRLFYRVQGSDNYQHIDLQEQADSYTGSIPARQVEAPGMEYFLSAVLSNQNLVTHPARNPYYAPHRINIVQRPGRVEPEPPATPKPQVRKTSSSKISFLILSPEPNETITKEDVLIAVSILIQEGSIDSSSIKLMVDGKDVTPQTHIADFIISYVPTRISTGRHRVRLLANDAEGNAIKPVNWTFWVEDEKQLASEKKKASPFTGKFFVDAKNENISDSTRLTLNTGADFHGEYQGIRFRGHAFVTSREQREFQPRNRFSLDVGTKWFGVKLGDTYPRFNDLMLWGKRVRGLEAYLKLGYFNIEFVQGETNRAIDNIYKMNGILQYNAIGDTLTDKNGHPKWLNPITGVIDSSTTGLFKYGTYKQTLMGIRPSFGSGKYFQLGLNLLKVKDDVESISVGVYPKDNLVVGPDLLLTFDDRKVEFRAGAAFSMTTHDISDGVVSKTQIDTTFDMDIPFDPADFEKYLIINTSTTPLDPTQMSSLAYNMQFRWSAWKNTFQIRYKSIGSEYNSLGNTFLRKDIAGFSVTDRVRVYKNQVYLTLGYEQFLDGLSKQDDGNDGTEPTDLASYTIGVSYFPREKTLPRITLGYKNRLRNNDLDATINTAAIDNNSQDISLQFGYDLQFLNSDHSVNFSIIGSDRIDEYNPQLANISNDIRMLTFQTKYQIPLTTVFTLASNENSTGQGIANEYAFKYTLIGLNATYMMLNNKLRLTGGVNNTAAIGSKPGIETDPLTGSFIFVTEDYTDFNRLSFEIGASYQITPKQYVLLDTRIISFEDKISDSYNDSIIRLRYEYQY